MQNEDRRVLFNPKFEMSRSYKSKIVNTYTGKVRSRKTINLIREGIESWDVGKLGKITQKSLAKVLGMNVKTIQKYYKLFKDEIFEVNSVLRYDVFV